MAEIQVTDEKGNLHVFPDGSTPEMISKAMNLTPAAPDKLAPQGGWSFGDLGRGALAGAKQLVAHPIDTLASGIQGAMASGMSPMGEGYPSTAPTGRPIDQQANAQLQQNAQQGQADAAKFIGQNPAYALGSTATQTAMLGAATHGLAKAGGAVMAEKPPVAPPAYEAPHAAAFEGAIAPATGMGKNFVPQDVTPQALGPIRQTASRMTQGAPMERVIVQAATDPSTPPLARVKAYQGVVQTALNDLEAQHAPALASAADTPVNTDPLVRNLMSNITKTTDPADVSAIRNLMMRVKQIDNLGDLNNFRQELNTETAPEYKQSQIQAGRSGLSVQAASDLAGDVRSQYYADLGKATGVDYAPLKMQESNLLTTLEALQNQKSTLARSEATFNAPSTLKETIGNVANVIKDPKTTITQTILRESPATRISTLLQKSLADLQPAPQNAPQLTAGTPQLGAPPGGPTGPTPAPPFYNNTQAARMGRVLPAQAGGKTILPYNPEMTAGEKSAALLQYLRQRQQLALPANAEPIRLPPPQ